MRYLTEIIGSVTGLGVAGLIALAWPPQPFLTVHSLEVAGQEVWADRTLNFDGRTIADWRVTIVPLDRESPICQTIPGPDLHEGWSVYDGGQNGLRHWSVDVWVGDEGCQSRLIEAEYDMFVTWTPRDGSPPVVSHIVFSWE